MHQVVLLFGEARRAVAGSPSSLVASWWRRLFCLCLLGLGGVLGDGLGALGDGVLGELSREHEADGGLDLTAREGGLLVVDGDLGGLRGWGRAVSVRRKRVGNEGCWSGSAASPARSLFPPTSPARRPKMSLMNEFMIDMPFLEMPVSGWTCLSTL